jgi:hypothetical protein
MLFYVANNFWMHLLIDESKISLSVVENIDKNTRDVEGIEVCGLSL